MNDQKKLELDDNMLNDVAGGVGPGIFEADNLVPGGVPSLDQLNRMNWLRTQPCKKKQGGGFHEPCIKDGKCFCSICGET